MFYRIIRGMTGQKCNHKKLKIFPHTSGTRNYLSTGPLFQSQSPQTRIKPTYISKRNYIPTRKGFARSVLTVGSSFNLRRGMDNKIMEENSPFQKGGGVCCVVFRQQQSKLPADSNNQSNYPWQFNSQ